MSTKRESGSKSLGDVFTELAKSATPTTVDDSAAALEAALQREYDSRREERFMWIFVCAVFVNLATFPHLSWIAIICVFLLEIIGLIALASMLGHERVVIFLEKLFYAICEKVGLGKLTNP